MTWYYRLELFKGVNTVAKNKGIPWRPSYNATRFFYPGDRRYSYRCKTWEGVSWKPSLIPGGQGKGERMPGSMKNDDAALVKEMKSGPPRKKKVESAGGVENRRVAIG